MDLDKLRKSSGGRSKFSLPSFPRLSRNSSSAAGGQGPRGRRQAFGAVHFKKEKIFKQVVAAIEKKDSERIEELLAGVDYCELDDTGALIHKAVRQDSLELVNVLLSHGAPVNSNNNANNANNTTSATSTAAMANDASPLHIAARHGSVAMVSVLLANSADVNARTKSERRTPLHYAALAGSDDVARMLVGAGAEKDPLDIYGSTPLHLASQACHVEVVSFLLEGGVNVQQYDKEGWTSLHLAADAGHCVIASLLLGSHANLDAQTKFGRTALHWACMKGHIEMAKLLLGDGASVEIKDLHDKTPDRYVSEQPELAYLIRQAKKPVFSHTPETATIGQYVEIAVEREVSQDKKQRERKKADLLTIIPTSESGSMMSVILEEEREAAATDATDDVDDGFVSQLDTSSPQTSSEAEIPVKPKENIKHRESCVECDALNLLKDRNKRSACMLHRMRDNSDELQRVQNRIDLNFRAFSADVDQITRQVTRAMDGDERCANLLCDTFPSLRVLRSKLEAFKSDLEGDLQHTVVDLEDYVGELHVKQSETEVKVPRKVKLIARFCQAVATTLTTDNITVWTHLLKSLPLDKPARDKMMKKVRRHNYASECANVHEVLLLFLQHRNGDMTLFIKTVLDAIDLEEIIAKYKDDIISHLVTSLGGKSGGCPSRATITTVAESLSEAAIADIAREIGMTPDKLQTIKRLSEASEGSESAEILSSFLHAADDLPILDKMRILTDALVFVRREDLLIVLYEQ